MFVIGKVHILQYMCSTHTAVCVELKYHNYNPYHFINLSSALVQLSYCTILYNHVIIIINFFNINNINIA